MRIARIIWLATLAAISGVSALAQSGVVAPVVGFTGTNGSAPFAPLTLGADGDLYGTTTSGGPGGYGTIFEVDSNNVPHLRAVFEGTNGSDPVGQLLLATNGNFYGVTYQGGASGFGTIYEFTTNNQLISLYSFDGTNGSMPWAGLMQASNGNFYGTASAGGIGFFDGVGGSGTLFVMTPAGVFSNLYFFTGGNDGLTPYGKLVQGTNGNLYGTTDSGGPGGNGVVFEWALDPGFSVRYAFWGTNGSAPIAGLTVGGSYLWGTTTQGGPYNAGVLFALDYSGGFTVLHYFTEIGSDGALPYGQLLLRGRDYYGTTYLGGLYGRGTIYKVSLPTNSIPCYVPLVSFRGLNDGGYPESGLTLNRLGNFYGTTTYSSPGNGTVFEYVGLPRLGGSTVSGNTFNFNAWDVQPGLVYQPLWSPTLSAPTWPAFGPSFTATTNKYSFSSGIHPGAEYYRLQATLPVKLSF